MLALHLRAFADVAGPPSLQVNSAGQLETVAVPITASGTLAEIRVLTLGVANADYVLSSAGTCVVGASFTAPTSSCLVSVTFQPKAPGIRLGAVVLVSDQGSVLGTQRVSGIGIGPVGVFSPATITTVTGNGHWLYTGDGGAATDTSIFLPGGVAVDAVGNFYVADSGNNRIRLVNAATGIISTVAGVGSPSSANDGGPALNAGISNPGALLLDGAGDLYIADSSNHAIRKLSLATGKLTTVAGQLNQQGYSGDGGPATAATLNTPEGLAFDLNGNLLIADTKNHAVRKVDNQTGLISTYAGTQAGFAGDGGLATAAMLNGPWGLATDVLGNLFIADLNNNRIRKVSNNGTITTVVGDGTSNVAVDGQIGTATSISNPAAVAVDVAGNLYVADSGHNVVRKLNAATGLMWAVAGTSNPVFAGDGAPATLAGLYGPYALTLDSAGNLYIADIFHHRIREVEAAQATLAYQPIRVGRTSPSQAQVIENDGNGPLTFSNLNPDSNASVSASATTCVVGTSLAVDATCIIGAEFSPQITGKSVTALIQPLSDAIDSPGTITLTGEVDQLEPTRTSLLSSTNPAALGSNITFTANVAGNAGQPSGTIRFYDGTTLLGSADTNATGTAVFQTSALALGSHNIAANFTGDAQNSPSTSSILAQVVKRAPAVALSSNLNPSQVGQAVTLTANVTVSGSQPTGTVVFSDGATPVATIAVDSSGNAAYVVSTLTAGAHSFTAAYSGDTNTLPGTSSAVSQSVQKWSSSITLGSSNTSATIGDTLTFSVSVIPTSTVIPSGSVTLKDGATVLSVLKLDSTGAATYPTSALAVGTHTLTAEFAGDAANAASSSALLSQSIQQLQTGTTLVSSANPSNGGALLHLTAKVTPSATNSTAGALSGTITFKEGATVLGTGPLSADGSFTLDLSTLAVADHIIVATYSGNTNYAISSSSPLDEKVTLATTSVQLATSASSIIVGNSIVLTAVVAGNGSVPTGTVSFSDGPTSLGSATLNSSGQANLTLKNLLSGSHPITASYGGDAENNGSVSAAITETVNQATTAISLTSSSNPSIAGTSLTFVATLTSNGSLPTGSLILHDGSSVVGNALISPTGSAQFPLSNLSAQSHSFTATFAGDADHLPSTSSTLVQLVQLGTSTVTIGSGANPGLLGSPIVFTARVNGTGNQPTGSVTFLDGATTLAAAPLSNGTATASVSSLTIGSHSITVRYDGDTTHSAGAPASLTETVQQSTATTIVSNSSPALVGAPVTFTATVTGASTSPAGGAVEFFDGATLLGTSPLSGVGTSSYTSVTLGAGVHLITASYLGDQNDRASASAALSQAINTADTSVTLTSSANPSVAGTAITFTAGVISRGRAAAGSVTFLDGSAVLGTAPVISGTANLTIKSLSAGLHAVTARYGGDTGTQISTSGVLLEVAQQQTTAVLVSSLNPALTDQSITLAGSVGNGSQATGTLSFFDGTAALGTVSLDSNGTAAITVPSLPAGTHLLSVHYSGDSYNLPSVSSSLNEGVQFRPTTASMTASSNGYLDGQQVTLVAVLHYSGPVVPSGTVTFTANGQVLGTASVSSAAAATLTLEPTASRYDIVATYAGDAVYSGSTTATYTITKGTSTSFSISSDPGAFSLKSGDHRSMTLTLTASAGFNDTLSLGCLDLPRDATCTFSSNQMKLAGGSTGNLTVVFDTGNPLGSGAAATTASLRANRRSSLVTAGFLYPAAIVLGVLLMIARRGRRLSALLSILVLVGVGLSATGCGNTLNTSTTPSGSYTVRVIATGAQSSISQIADIAVTVQ